MASSTAESTSRRTPGSGATEPVLSVRDLVIDYRVDGKESRAVDGVSFDLQQGESLALIGESGCGKTTLALALLRLLPRLGSIRSGEIHYRRRDGEVVDLLTMNQSQLRSFRWRECAMVFQGAMNSFNPVLRIHDQMADTIRAHEGNVGRETIRRRSLEVLEQVRLDAERVLWAYPHELSGGMRQRVLIAMSLLLDPQVLLLDEPTTALDILTQRAIVDLIHELRAEHDFSMVFVSHDLPLAAELADTVATMYAGEIVEMNDVREIFYRPQHDYTASLIAAVPPIADEALGNADHRSEDDTNSEGRS